MPLVVGWAAALITALLWPFLLPHDGMLALRDMVVIDRPALSENALGWGNLPARNAPQDGLLAIIGQIIPAPWAVRVALLAAAIGGAVGAARLGQSQWQRIAAITVTLWNPFVVERLLQGHWSLVIAAWLVPLLLGQGRLVALWVASITPTGAVLGAVIAAVSAPTRRLRLVVMAISAVLFLPWLLPSMIAPPAGVTDVFFPRAEGYVGRLGAFVGLGGIWNAEVIPPSRESGFAIAGIILCAITVWYAPHRYQLLALVGVVTMYAVTPWTLAHIPGVVLFRDSAKLSMLLLPAMIYGAARIHPRSLVTAAILAALLQVPDAPLAVRPLAPVAQPELPRTTGKLLIVDSHGLVSYQGRTIVDPRIKANATVESGALSVDGQVIDAPSPAYSQATAAWHRGDHNYLREQGITAVIDHGKFTPIADSTPQRTAGFYLGLGCLVLWAAAGICGCVITRRNSRPVSSHENVDAKS